MGFQSGRRTADHIFVLKTIIDKHINQKNEKIYACFADFKKAFDSVWHEGLFLKLLDNKIDGHFYNSFSKGVRQGCILRPLLFNIYINELATLFDNTAADPFILPNGIKLSCLLYADDLILLARSKFGLQKSLDDLHFWRKKMAYGAKFEENTNNDI
jgi:hypothetical protein